MRASFIVKWDSGPCFPSDSDAGVPCLLTGKPVHGYTVMTPVDPAAPPDTVVVVVEADQAEITRLIDDENCQLVEIL